MIKKWISVPSISYEEMIQILQQLDQPSLIVLDIDGTILTSQDGGIGSIEWLYYAQSVLSSDYNVSPIQHHHILPRISQGLCHPKLVQTLVNLPPKSHIVYNTARHVSMKALTLQHLQAVGLKVNIEDLLINQCQSKAQLFQNFLSRNPQYNRLPVLYFDDTISHFQSMVPLCTRSFHLKPTRLRSHREYLQSFQQNPNFSFYKDDYSGQWNDKTMELKHKEYIFRMYGECISSQSIPRNNID